jgi:CHAT domain-containing protein
VLVTLRPVGDVAAGEFMDRFYRHWLAQARSDPAAALHQTQRDYIGGRDKGDRDSFILIGGTVRWIVQSKIGGRVKSRWFRAPATKKTTIISRLRKASERTSGAFLFMSDPYPKNVGRRASGIVRNPVLVRT